MNNEIV